MPTNSFNDSVLSVWDSKYTDKPIFYYWFQDNMSEENYRKMVETDSFEAMLNELNVYGFYGQ